MPSSVPGSTPSVPITIRVENDSRHRVDGFVQIPVTLRAVADIGARCVGRARSAPWLPSPRVATPIEIVTGTDGNGRQHHNAGRGRLLDCSVTASWRVTGDQVDGRARVVVVPS